MTSSANLAVAAARPLLRAGGERMTQPRAAVIEALATVNDHVTADEVAALVGASPAGAPSIGDPPGGHSSAGHSPTPMPTVHLATVYRCLDVLGRLGVVQHVHVPNGATKYYLAPELTGAASHAHAQCQRCSRVFDYPLAALREVSAYLQDEHGFSLDAGHAALSGVCADCRT